MTKSRAQALAAKVELNGLRDPHIFISPMTAADFGCPQELIDACGSLFILQRFRGSWSLYPVEAV